jgi:hypothetical protein
MAANAVGGDSQRLIDFKRIGGEAFEALGLAF